MNELWNEQPETVENEFPLGHIKNPHQSNDQYVAWEDWAAMDLANEILGIDAKYQSAEIYKDKIDHFMGDHYDAMYKRKYSALAKQYLDEKLRKVAQFEDFEKRGYKYDELKYASIEDLMIN